MRQASKWKKERKKIHFNVNYLVKISSQTITQKKKTRRILANKNRFISNSKNLKPVQVFRSQGPKQIHNLYTLRALWI